MTITQQIMTILVVVLGTMTTRFITFLIFPESKEPPQFVRYLGEILPSAVLALLVIYTFKNYQIPFSQQNWYGFIATFVVIIIHLFKRNLLLSISIGTIVYMVLIQSF